MRKRLCGGSAVSFYIQIEKTVSREPSGVWRPDAKPHPTLPGSPPQALPAERTHHSAKMRRINANPASGALQFYPIRGILKGGNPTVFPSLFSILFCVIVGRSKTIADETEIFPAQACGNSAETLVVEAEEAGEERARPGASEARHLFWRPGLSRIAQICGCEHSSRPERFLGRWSATSEECACNLQLLQSWS